MTAQTSKGKVTHIHNELIRRITFGYVKLLSLKWPQNKVVPNIAITEKKEKHTLPHKSHILYMPEAFWDKVTDFIDEPVVQCDVPVVKTTSLDDGNNDDRK